MSPRSRPAWLRRRADDREVMERLAIAMTAGDVDGIRAFLHPDVQLVIDSGGFPVPGPAEGSVAVAACLLGLLAPKTSVETASINGVPGIVLVRDDRVHAAVTADICAGLPANVWVVCNPDKLRHWNRWTPGSR